MPLYCELWGHSIGVMVFILYKTVFSFALQPTQLTHYSKLCIFTVSKKLLLYYFTPLKYGDMGKCPHRFKIHVSQFLSSCSGQRLPNGSKIKRRLPGWFESLIIFTALLCSVWGRCPAERGEQTLRCAQLSAHNYMQGFAVLIGDVSIPQWVRTQPLWGSFVQGDGVWGELAYFHYWGLAGEAVLNPVPEFRPRSLSLTASLMGTIVLKAEQ